MTMTGPRPLEPIPAPEPVRPPIRHLGLREWVKQNLFGGPFSTVATIVFSAFFVWAGYRAIRFLFVTGRWGIVRTNFTFYLVGAFPRDELWRPWAALYLLVALVGLRWGISLRRRRAAGDPTTRSWRAPVQRLWPLALLSLLFIVVSWSVVSTVAILGLIALTLIGRSAGARIPDRAARFFPVVFVVGVVVAFRLIAGFGGVGFGRWEGLLLTMFLAIGGILLSFPLGVLLALGRRSTFPAIRSLCVAYIELIRGVPLITVLFMGVFVVPLFLPPGRGNPSNVAVALIGLIMFTAAYVAEIVRGGLQAVPKGQVEAAQALGLGPARITALIVLPQALRAVIPAMVGQFISLFKDTSLVGFIGLLELLGAARAVTSQPRFLGQGLQAESFVFAAFVYWVGAYWMSKASQRLEKRLGVGER